MIKDEKEKYVNTDVMSEAINGVIDRLKKGLWYLKSENKHSIELTTEEPYLKLSYQEYMSQENALYLTVKVEKRSGQPIFSSIDGFDSKFEHRGELTINLYDYVDTCQEELELLVSTMKKVASRSYTVLFKNLVKRLKVMVINVRKQINC